MPDEPTRRIEEELRAYAEQRRAEAGQPFELHPVNRRLLQDEVARTFGSGEARVETGRSWLKLLWPRLALAGAICLIGAFVVLQFTPAKTRSKYQMAKTAAPAESTPTAQPAVPPPMPVPAPAPEARGERDSGDRFVSSARSDLQVESKARGAEVEAAPELAKPKDVAPAAPPLVSAASAPADSSPEAMMRRRYGLRPAPGREVTQTRAAPESVTQSQPSRTQRALQPDLARASETRQPAVLAEEAFGAAGTRGVEPAAAVALAPRPSPAQPAPATSLALRVEPGSKAKTGAFAFTGSSPAQPGQQFVQVEAYRRNFNSPRLPPVLRSFQLRQSGSQIEIVDADGSIYRGGLGKTESERDKLATTPPAESLDRPTQVDSAAGLAQARPLGDAKAAARPGLLFYVVGTNLSLNERVAFEGEMVTGTNVFGVGYVAGGQAGQPAIRTSPPTSVSAPTAVPRQLVPLLRIQGRAVVGEATKLEINAVPATP
jgi:hypothetical protein